MKQIISDETFGNEIIVKKSRFLTLIKKVTSKLELDAFLANRIDSKATHNCYAYQYYKNNVPMQGFYNDGEPVGTAGEPLLRLINLNNVSNVCILVIRYFGGIKLGAGPLKRTYTSGARDLLNREIKFIPEKVNSATFVIDINDISFINKFLNQQQKWIVTKTYDGSFVNIFIESFEQIDLSEIQHLIT